jgi:oxalate decarboxylase
MVRLTRFCNHSFPYRNWYFGAVSSSLSRQGIMSASESTPSSYPEYRFPFYITNLQPDTGAAAGLFGNSSYVFHQSQKAVVPVPGGGGNLSIIDSRNFPIAKTIAATVVSLEPNGLRELHWHPNVSQRHLIIEGFF